MPGLAVKTPIPRMSFSLSIKNGWLDEGGKNYIHYSVADIMADTGCGKNKILKCLKEFTTQTSRSPERKPLEVYDANPNNTNINYINPILLIYTEDGMDEYQAYSEIVRENIDMDSLMQRYPYEQKDVRRFMT